MNAATLLLFGALAIAAYALVARRLAAALPMLIVLDPFAVTRYAGHSTITTFKAAIVGICVALVGRNALFAPRTPALRWMIVTLAVVVAATALTIPVAAFHAPAVRETLKAVEYLLIFYVAACVTRAEPEAVRWAALAAAVAIAAVALGSLLDYQHPQSAIVIDGHAYTRLAGALEGPNQLAAWLGIMLAPAVTSVIPGVPVAVALGGAILALTLSRGGTAQAIGTLIAIAALVRATRIAVAIAVSAFVITLVAFAPFAHLLSFTSSVDPGGTASRGILWRAAIAMFHAHPLLGVGAGNFELMLPSFGAPPGVRTQANSLYLEALADGGLVLAIVTIAAAWLPPLLLLRARATPFVLAAGIAGIALALHGFIDDLTFYTKVGQVWWLIAGAAAGVLEARTTATHPAPVPPSAS